MKLLRHPALVVLSGFVLVGSTSLLIAQETREASAPAQILPILRAELNKPAPHFALKDTDGKTWKLADLKGQTVVLEWFNPDCPVVREAHSEGGVLQALGNRTHAVENVTWLAINSGAEGQQGFGKDRNAESRTQYGIEYPVLLDESGAIGRAYGATTTPHMYIIDPNGILTYVGGHHDRKSGNLIGPAIAQALKGQKPDPARTPNRGCSVKYPTTATLGAVTPNFELKDLDGKNYNLADFAGKVVVLEWFNPQCPVVAAAHDGGALTTLAEELTRSGQVVWLAVNSGAKEDPSSSKAANQEKATKWNLKHPILLDPSGRAGKAYGARVTPQMYVLDTHGVLMYEGNPGDESTPFVKSTVTRLLNGEAVAPIKTEAQGCSVKYAKDKDAEGEGKPSPQ